jgi:hypothetical protein
MNIVGNRVAALALGIEVQGWQIGDWAGVSWGQARFRCVLTME